MNFYFGKPRRPMNFVTYTYGYYLADSEGKEKYIPEPSPIHRGIKKLYGISISGTFIGIIRYYEPSDAPTSLDP
jgi:hypothetical protein